MDNQKQHMTDRADSFAKRFIEKYRAEVPKAPAPQPELTGDSALAYELSKLKEGLAKINGVRNAQQ